MKNKYDVDVYSLPELKYEELYRIKSGVYFLFSSKYGELLYVGQSKNVRKRIDTHIKNFEDLYTYTRFLDRFLLGYKVIPVPEKDLILTEELFIQKYNPPMNFTHNGKPHRDSYKMWIWKRIEEYDAAEKAGA